MRSAALLLLLIATPALAAPKYRVAAPRCVIVTDHQVFPVKDARIDSGTFRCTAKVTAPKSAPPQSAAVLSLRQGGKELAKAEAQIALSPGSVEIELQLEVPETLDGCSRYELVTRVGDGEAVVRTSPTCPD